MHFDIFYCIPLLYLSLSALWEIRPNEFLLPILLMLPDAQFVKEAEKVFEFKEKDYLKSGVRFFKPVIVIFVGQLITVVVAM